MNIIHKLFLKICFLLLATSGFSFNLQPMVAHLETRGNESFKTFEVTNDGNTSVAVRFTLLTRSSTPGGLEFNENAAEYFSITPDFFVMEPNSKVTLTLEWKGPEEVLNELAFRLVAETLPVEDDGSSIASGIQVLFRYVASVYVGNETFSPSLITTVVGALGPLGETGFKIKVVNHGTRHVIVDSLRLSVPISNRNILRLGKKDLGALFGANYLPEIPLERFLPHPDAEDGKVYYAWIKYDTEY